MKRSTGGGLLPACAVLGTALLALLCAPHVSGAAVSSVTPRTWNIVGLDSNTPAFGPNRFPVGASVCSSDATATASIVFDDGLDPYSGHPYINLRPGSNQTVTIKTAGGCADAYFEVEVAKTSAAFDQTRRYHITAGGVSTPQPRELYVEHLISQSRNGIDTVKYGPSTASLTSVPSGGSMNLLVGNTYVIELDGHTAPGGYNQFEEFINFPNTIFQVLSVNTTYSALSAPSPYVSSPNPSVYADACLWESDPTSPYYRSCVGGDEKAGSTVITQYTVKILSGGGSSQSLNDLLYDFSGSSFHYNADYSTGARIANIIDPSMVGFSKSFGPATTTPGGNSTLTFTITNPNAGTLTGLNFSDILPTSPGAMVVAATPNATTSGCGTPTFAPVAGSGSISFANGTVAANSSCTVSVNVTAPAIDNASYTNTTGNLFIGSIDTGKTASATLTVNSTAAPVPAGATCGLELADWTMAAAQGTTVPPVYAAKAPNVASATASYSGTGTSVISTATGNPVNAWSVTGGWASGPTGYPTAVSPAPYLEFKVDSSKFSSVGISFDFYLDGNWANSANNVLYVYSSADGVNFTNVRTVTAPTKRSWLNTSATASATGSGSTWFRINAVGQQQNTAVLYLDNVAVTGCGYPLPPTITKGFAPAAVGVNGTSTLTLTLTNPNPVQIVNTTADQLTGVKFVDPLPSGLKVAATPSASTTCAGSPTWVPAAGATTLNFGQVTGATLAPNSSCTVSVNVTPTAGGTYQNVTGFVSATESGANTSATGSATASLRAIAPPQLSKRFQTNPVLGGGTSRLVFTLSNPNQNDDLTAVSFTDVFPTSPGAMVVASPFYSSNGCGGTLTNNLGGALATGSAGVRLSGATVPKGSSCTVAVDVTAPVKSQLATVASISDDTHLTLASPYAGSSASGLTMSKSVSAALSGTATVTGNSTAVVGTGTKFTSELSVNSVIYLGTYSNTSGAISDSNAGTGNSASDILVATQAHPLITFFKEVASSNNSSSTVWTDYLPASAGGQVYYQFTVQNDGDVPLSSVSVTDNQLNIALCSWRDGDGSPLTVPFTLAVGNSTNNKDFATCVLGPYTALIGSHQNDASATGYYNSTPYTDTDWAIYATTGLTLAKSASQSYFAKAGDVINYSYLVTNSGSAMLAGPITVSDDKVTVSCPAVSSVGNRDNDFDAGETMTCTASYTVTATDVTAKQLTNTASASTASSGSIPGVTSATAVKTVPLAADLIAVAGNNVAGSVNMGSSFTWTLSVANLASAGTANFASGQILFSDDLPSSNLSYAVGTPTKAGVTGNVSCAITANTLTCSASGAVTMPSGLTGTVSVTSGSATVTGSGTSFTSQLAAGSVLLLNGTGYSVLSIQSDSQLTLALPYSGATASGLQVPSSFSVAVTVTPSSGGTFTDPRSGGVCKANPASAIPEIDASNNSCSDTVNVLNLPVLTILKSWQTLSDPVNGSSNPKGIPGAVVQYTIQVVNSGLGSADNNSMVATDVVPANTSICVSSVCSSPPVAFSCSSTPPCGLSYSYASAVSYSNQPGGVAPYNYTPVPDASGFDANVTGVRVNPQGIFSAASGGDNSSFSVAFKVRIK